MSVVMLIALSQSCQLCSAAKKGKRKGTSQNLLVSFTFLHQLTSISLGAFGIVQL